jgi:hypothetical protein
MRFAEEMPSLRHFGECFYAARLQWISEEAGTLAQV